MGVFLLFDGAREVFALIVGMGQGSILFNEGEAHKGRQVQGKGASPVPTRWKGVGGSEKGPNGPSIVPVFLVQYTIRRNGIIIVDPLY